VGRADTCRCRVLFDETVSLERPQQPVNRPLASPRRSESSLTPSRPGPPARPLRMRIARRRIGSLVGGPGRLGVSELSEASGWPKGRFTGCCGRSRLTSRRTTPRQRQVSARPTAAPALEPLPRSERAAVRSLAYSEALAGRADEAVRVGAFHGDGMLVVHHVFRPDTKPPDPRGRLPTPPARDCSRQGGARLPRRRGSARPSSDPRLRS